MSVLPNFETQAGTETFAGGSLYDKSWHVSVCAKHASLMYGIVNAVLKPDTIGTHIISLRRPQRRAGIESGWYNPHAWHLGCPSQNGDLYSPFKTLFLFLFDHTAQSPPNLGRGPKHCYYKNIAQDTIAIFSCDGEIRLPRSPRPGRSRSPFTVHLKSSFSFTSQDLNPSYSLIYLSFSSVGS